MHLCARVTHDRDKIVSMDILHKAIAIEGGIPNLAKALRHGDGSSPSDTAVYNWIARESVPVGWLVVMQDRYSANATPMHQRERNLAGQAFVGGSKGCV